MKCSKASDQHVADGMPRTLQEADRGVGSGHCSIRWFYGDMLAAQLGGAGSLR
jgi:hypothetical protein